MTARSALTVVGQAVGGYFFGPVGGAVGGFLGGAIGGAIDGPQRNTQDLLSDLTAIKFDYGSSWPRIYGRYRFKVAPMWSSTKRPIEHEQDVDSKGGPAAVNKTFTYDQDWLCWAPLGAIGFARIWENGTIRYSGLADSSDATLAASQATTAWRGLTFLDGNPAQLPWTVYEAAVGTDNAVAGRYRPMLAFEALDLGGSGQPPLIEVEFYSAGTSDAGSGFVEQFSDDGIAHYTWSPGVDTDIYQVVDEGSGPILNVKGGVVTSISTSITRDFPDVAGVTRISIDFRQDDLLTLPDPAAPDDGPTIRILGTSGLIFELDTAREKFFDSGQRPHGSVEAALYQALSPSPVTVDSFYTAVLSQDSPTSCSVTLIDRGTGGIVGVTTFSGTFTPWTVNAIEIFDQGSFSGGGSKPSASFDNIIIGSPVPRVTLEPVLLSDIVLSEALLLWSGVDGALTADDIDVTELEAIEVTGFATTGSPREAIAQLMDMYYFGCVCSDKLYFRLRGAASIGTVPFDQSGIAVGQPGIPFTGVERGNDLEVPIQVAVTGPNVLADYDPGTEQSDRLVGESVAVTQYTTPVVFTPAERKGRADTMVLDGRVASNTAKISLDDRHIEKEPFDVWIQTDDQGNSYRVRSVGESYADGVHDHDVVLDDPTVLSSVGITTNTDLRAITVAAVPATVVVPLDIPIGRDADDFRGLYVAVKPAATAGWSGYSFFESADNVSYSKLGSGTKSTILGLCTTVPGNWMRGRVFNYVDSIVVEMGDGAMPSATRAQVLADETVNAFAIGAHGRWMLGQYLTATLTAPGIYTLTGLLTGSKGTEQHIGTQVVGDTFVLLKTTGGVIRVPQQAIDQGALRYYKAVSIGKTLDTSNSGTITEQEVGLMPLSPFRVRVSRDTSGNATITWQRRTRLATRTSGPAGILIPMGEEIEAYSIDICTDGTFATIARTLTSASETVAFSAADQTTYLGAPANPLFVKVHQLSTAVGRGFPAQKAA